MLPSHPLAWAAFLAFILGMLALDLFVLHRKPHQISLREALLGALIPVVVALAFLGIIYYAYDHHLFDLGLFPPGDPRHDSPLWADNGPEAALLYLTGYLVEISLSADNVFLFVLLINFFAVPAALQHRVLFWGVLGALIMRAAMIAGVSFLARFDLVIYLFGAFLIFTGIKMLFSSHEETDPSASLMVRLARRLLPLHPAYDGRKFFTRITDPAGRTRTLATTLFLVLLAVEFTDVVFAVDSIPAVFGITKDPFLVFTSNVFAILGLRSLYFLLAGIMDKFHLLKYGLAVVLAFVGVKMLLPGLANLYARFASLPASPHWDVPKLLSLAVITATLAVAILASLLIPPRRSTQSRAATVRERP